MNENRFYRNRGTIWENDRSLSLEEVENRLNELSTENRHLKKQLNTEHQQLENAILLERT